MQGAPHSAGSSCAALWGCKESWAAQPGWGGSCGDWWGLCPAASLWGEAGLWGPGHAVKRWKGESGGSLELREHWVAQGQED